MSSDEEIPFDGSVPNHSQLYNVLRGHPPDGVVRDTRTYRSRIESYSPDFLEAETKKMQQRQSRPRSRSRSRPQHRSRPRSRPHQHPPHSHSHSHPLAQPKRKASEARPYNARYSQEQMSEMYKKWYQGRGSEVGRGLWQVEMNKAARKDQGLDRRRNAVVHWEPEEDAAQGKNLDVVTKPNPVL